MQSSWNSVDWQMTTNREATRAQATGMEFLSYSRDGQETADPDNPGSFLSGVDIIVRMLTQILGPEMDTLSLSYLKDYFAFRWNQGETIDNYLLRAEMTYQRCVKHCGLGISPAGKAYLSIQQLHIRREGLVQMVRDTRGHLPTTEGELETMRRTFTQFLNITKPHLFTRTFAAEEKEENTTNTYITDGSFVSQHSRNSCSS